MPAGVARSACGELVDSFPKAKGAPAVINLICKYSPDDFAAGFLEKAAAAIEDAGFSLRYSVADAKTSHISTSR
ncbi:DUF6572 domain-containing protein [Duganella vulcania]|uniref:DUF6572 domain-containing protein n=1 Tax=Duganella vulcania TaxID=2692166 RepID=UPI0035A39BEF